MTTINEIFNTYAPQYIRCFGDHMPKIHLKLSTPLIAAVRQPVAWSSSVVRTVVNPTKCSAPAVIDTAQCVKTIRLGSGFKASFNGNSPAITLWLPLPYLSS